MVCSLERRAHAAPFTLPVIRQRGRRPSHAIPKPAAKSGVRTKAILAIQLTGMFIATSVSICPWNIRSIVRGTRKFFGIKHHRITGRRDDKQLYNRTAAQNAAAQHAIHFLEQCREQICEIGEFRFEPIIVAPFDAELFGHWWFEGPIFLEAFIRYAVNHGDFQLTTPSEYLAAHPTQQIVEPAASTWGENRHLAVWLDSSNAWIYPNSLRQPCGCVKSRDDMRQTARNGQTFAIAYIKQLARELLLAQIK